MEQQSAFYDAAAILNQLLLRTYQALVHGSGIDVNNLVSSAADTVEACDYIGQSSLCLQPPRLPSNCSYCVVHTGLNLTSKESALPM